MTGLNPTIQEDADLIRECARDYVNADPASARIYFASMADALTGALV
jgi:hypothetical protein